jgi:penicillin-binding protein
MTGIYNGIEAINVKINPKYPKTLKADKDGKVTIPFSISMETLAGEVKIDNNAILVKEKENDKETWKLTWTDKMIFPQLEPGDKVGAKYELAKRGEIRDRNDKVLAGAGIGNAKRSYPLGEAAAHVVGYIKAISAEELKTLQNKGYTKYDSVGQNGAEKAFEARLKGENGGLIYINDSNGKKKADLFEKPKKDGENIKLTIDADLQNNLYAQLKGESGSAVAVQPKTGETLAMVSSPSFDPNLFALAQGIPVDKWNAISTNAAKPLINRAAGSFTPGSTFKVITGAIGLKTSKLNADEGINISGTSWRKDSSWGDYNVTRVDNVNGAINLAKAYIYSDNIYFAQASLKIGGENFMSEATNLGIGEDIPFELALQKSQINTDGKFKTDVRGEQQLADTGYGQGQVTMNPLQLAMIYGSIVNDGTILKPHLEAISNLPEVWKQSALPANVCSVLLSDLTQVVDNPDGTAYKGKIPNVPLAGKTGTAEMKQSQTDKTGTENGWFVAMNTSNPRLVVAMMIENVKNKGGSHFVVPKVSTVMKDYLK